MFNAIFRSFVTLSLFVLLANPSYASQHEFNPKISFIFDGVYYQDNEDGEGSTLAFEAPGINSHEDDDEEEEEDDHGHAHEGLDEGFNLREQELVMSASIDHYFDGFIVIAFTEEETEIEEAHFTTRALPAGLTVKGGKFFSGIGYHNQKHVHSWDFADQNMAYGSLLGDHGLRDTGLQVTWLPDLPFYTLVGAEVLQGREQERFGIIQEEPEEELNFDEEDSGAKINTFFVKVSPEFSDSHTLQLGAWFATAKQDQLELHHEDNGEEEELGLEGDATLWGLDLVYKMDAPEAFGENDLTIQAEYIKLDKDWTIQNGDEAGEDVTGKQDAFYLQAVYGIAPRVKAGIRYDATGMTNEIKLPDETEEFDESNRVSGVVTWYPTEFSFIRLQYSQADIADTDDKVNQVFLQFNYSLGAHGAHTF